MNEKRTSLEIIGPSIEEAVATGLDELNLSEDEVDIEVLDSGTKGLFGLGGRQARVRLTIKSASDKAKKPAPTPAVPVAVPMPVSGLGKTDEWEPEPVGGIEDPVLHTASQTVSELLQKMRVRARVSAQYLEDEDDRRRTTVRVDVNGDDLSILIGPRAETLNAIQYIANMIVNKELDQMVFVVVDVQGYRKRREQQVRQLALRMADQALKTGKRQVLEPMPPNERRWVHMELRSNAYVTTSSIGEEPRRKVTIIPKEE